MPRRAVLAVLATAGLVASFALGSAYAGGLWRASIPKEHGVQFARVLSDGTLVQHSKHVTSSSKGGTGEYFVNTRGQLDACAYTVTTRIGGESAALLFLTNQLRVDTSDSTGAAADREFYVIIAC